MRPPRPSVKARRAPVRAACTAPDAEACDPDTFVSGCAGDRPEYCNREFGFVGTDAVCALPDVCRVGAEGPVCAQSDGEPCDYLDYLPTCQPGALAAKVILEN